MYVKLQMKFLGKSEANYSQASLKLCIVLKDIWQRLKAHMMFFFSNVAYFFHEYVMQNTLDTLEIFDL